MKQISMIMLHLMWTRCTIGYWEWSFFIVFESLTFLLTYLGLASAANLATKVYDRYICKKRIEYGSAVSLENKIKYYYFFKIWVSQSNITTKLLYLFVFLCVNIKIL